MKSFNSLNFQLKNPLKKTTKTEAAPQTAKKGWRKRRIIPAVLLLIICVLLAIFAFFHFRRNKMQKNMETAFTTETAVIERQTLTNSISATGTVESAETKTVNTKISNRKVTAVYVNEGDYVTEGTVICEFDSTDYAEALAQAKNNYSVNQKISALEDDYTTVYNETVEQAEEGLAKIRETRDEAKDAYNQAKEALTTAKSALDSAAAAFSAYDPEINPDEALKTAYEQAQEAYQKAFETCEQTKAAYEQAQAKREEYQEQYESTLEKATYDYEKAALEKQLITETQEEKTIDEYTEFIEECVVKADTSGVITALNVTEGNNFEGGDIYTIQDNENFIVSATVDEYDISSIKNGMSAYVKTDATGDTEMSGEVTYVAIAPSGNGSMGASSSASYRIEITIQNPDENLRAGMTAKISIALEEALDVLTVPYDAVTTEPDGSSTITADVNGEKKTIPVETGLETDYYTEIRSDEISEGMTIYLSTPMTVAEPKNEDDIFIFDERMNGGGMPSGGDLPSGGGMPSGGGGGERPSGGGPGGF